MTSSPDMLTDFRRAEEFRDLRVGDKVTVHRDLSHPVHCDIRTDPYEGIVLTYRQDLSPVMGTATVVDVSTDTRGLPVARLSSGLSYDLTDGRQTNCEATYIHPWK